MFEIEALNCSANCVSVRHKLETSACKYKYKYKYM